MSFDVMRQLSGKLVKFAARMTANNRQDVLSLEILLARGKDGAA